MEAMIAAASQNSDSVFPGATSPQDVVPPERVAALESAKLADVSTQSAPELMRWEMPPRSLCIRFLQESDTPLLEWQGGADLRDWYQNQWRAHESGEITVLVVDFNNFPIGQAALHWQGKPTHPQIPDIQSLRVFSAFQGMGLGTKLIHACEQVVRQRVEHEGEDHEHISLSVGLENPRARALYERLGYIVVGEPYDDKWQYTDARGQIVHQSERVYDLVKSL